MHLRSITRLACGVVACAVAVGACAETLHGRVFDSERGEVFSAVRVVLTTKPERETTTDDYGTYRFDDIAPGGHILHVYAGAGVRTIPGSSFAVLLIAKRSAPTAVQVYVRPGAPTLHNLDLSYNRHMHGTND